MLNLLVSWPVLFYAPGAVFQAFVRGRNSRNLYDGSDLGAFLDGSVSELRKHLGLDGQALAATSGDRFAFAGFVARVVGLQLLIVTLLIALPLWLVFG